MWREGEGVSIVALFYVLAHEKELLECLKGVAKRGLVLHARGNPLGKHVAYCCLLEALICVHISKEEEE